MAKQTESQAVSQPYIGRKVTLNSRYAQTAYDRIFNSVSGSLYILGVILRIVGTEQDAQKVEKVVDDMITTVENEMEAEIVRLQALAESSGIEGAVPHYTNPATFEVQITSPRSDRFLRLIEMLDVIASNLDCLWLNHLLTDQQSQNAGYMWQRRVVRLANKIRETTSRAVSSAKKKDDNIHRQVQEVVETADVDVDEEIPEAA